MRSWLPNREELTRAIIGGAFFYAALILTTDWLPYTHWEWWAVAGAYVLAVSINTARLNRL